MTHAKTPHLVGKGTSIQIEVFHLQGQPPLLKNPLPWEELFIYTLNSPDSCAFVVLLLPSSQSGLSMSLIDDPGENKCSFSSAAFNWIEWHWTFILVSTPDYSILSSAVSTYILPIRKVRYRHLKLWCEISVNGFKVRTQGLCESML